MYLELFYKVRKSSRWGQKQKTSNFPREAQGSDQPASLESPVCTPWGQRAARLSAAAQAFSVMLLRWAFDCCCFSAIRLSAIPSFRVHLGFSVIVLDVVFLGPALVVLEAAFSDAQKARQSFGSTDPWACSHAVQSSGRSPWLRAGHLNISSLKEDWLPSL